MQYRRKKVIRAISCVPVLKLRSVRITSRLDRTSTLTLTRSLGVSLLPPFNVGMRTPEFTPRQQITPVKYRDVLCELY